MADSARKCRVYLLCRPISSGNNAHVRKAKKVKELMDRNRPLLLPLLQDVGEGEVVNILRELLNKRIFESELRAKVEFPDLFRSSIVRNAQRQASEIDASRSNAQLLDEIASQFDAVASSFRDAADPVEEAGDYNKVKIPKLLAKYMELTQWTKMFCENRKLNFIHSTEVDAGGFRGLLTTVSTLRHTAIHRLATTARDVRRLLESAVKLTLVLGDNIRTTQLENLHSDVNGQIEAMELNKNVLEDTTACCFRKIEEKREELDRMETELIRKMLKEDMDNKLLIGQQLENSVYAIFDWMKDGPDQGGKEDDEDGGDGGIGCGTDSEGERKIRRDLGQRDLGSLYGQ
ncbi:hypothetical protein VTK56DRAFT_3491 [Thermocarpiscus australiensis]